MATDYTPLEDHLSVHNSKMREIRPNCQSVYLEGEFREIGCLRAKRAFNFLKPASQHHVCDFVRRSSQMTLDGA